MTYNPARHHRRSIRLPAYDYAGPGAYFVTLVTYARECLFGQVIDSEMRLNVLGEVVAEEWRRTGEIRREVQLDLSVVMPNHIHGIVIIGDQTMNVGAHGRAPLHRSPRSLGSFIAGFKSAVTKRINEIQGTPRLQVWQRNYYEHVIRSEEELHQIRQYITDNPAQWDDDVENPQRSDQIHRRHRSRTAHTIV
jgi:putative transposase